MQIKRRDCSGNPISLESQPRGVRRSSYGGMFSVPLSSMYLCMRVYVYACVCVCVCVCVYICVWMHAQEPCICIRVFVCMYDGQDRSLEGTG